MLAFAVVWCRRVCVCWGGGGTLLDSPLLNRCSFFQITWLLHYASFWHYCHMETCWKITAEPNLLLPLPHHQYSTRSNLASYSVLPQVPIKTLINAMLQNGVEIGRPSRLQPIAFPILPYYSRLSEGRFPASNRIWLGAADRMQWQGEQSRGDWKRNKANGFRLQASNRGFGSPTPPASASRKPLRN